MAQVITTGSAVAATAARTAASACSGRVAGSSPMASAPASRAICCARSGRLPPPALCCQTRALRLEGHRLAVDEEDASRRGRAREPALAIAQVAPALEESRVDQDFLPRRRGQEVARTRDGLRRPEERERGHGAADCHN